MAKTKQSGVIRADAIPINVYNEGLVVYLYDEANASRLKELLRKHRLKRDFYNNLQAKEFRNVVAKESLCVAYTLEQDDPISVEVAVGKPLTKAELQVSRWHQPQKARLSLPSGRLRIDTPNTMPLDSDPPLDQGGTVQVNPGEYLLTLYRIDWDEMRRAGVRAKMPGEFILLTPLSTRNKLEVISGPILDFPGGKDTSWIQDFRVEETHSSCKLYFYGYREGFWLNLDRSALKRLKLQPGNRLRIETERLKFEALYLDRLSPDNYISFFGKQHVDQLTEKYKEFAFATWKKTEGRLLLQFTRYKCSRAVSERHLDTWIPATLSVLPDIWELPDLKTFPPIARARSDSVRSTFVMITDLDAVLNIRKSDLHKWNLSQGDQLSLTYNGETRTLVFCDHEKKSRWFHFITGKFPAKYYSTIEPFTHVGGKIFSTKGTTLRKELSVQWLPPEEQLPVVGYFDVFTKNEYFLRIRPIPVDCDIWSSPKSKREQSPHSKWIRATPGTSLLLKKQT